MLGTPFYFSTIRKITVGIGTLFNNIHLITRDATDAVVKDRKVPVSYAPRQGYIAKLREQQDEDGIANIQATLPRITFNLEGLEYDPTRKLNSIHTRSAVSATSSDVLLRQLNPVPYNFNFNVSVHVKNLEDGLQILEQILPTFTPSYNIVVNEIPTMDIKRDVPILLQGVQQEDNYGEVLETNRLITWSFDLIAKGHVYQPHGDASIIKKAIANIADEPSMTHLLETMGIEVTPLSAAETEPHTIVTTTTLADDQI